MSTFCGPKIRFDYPEKPLFVPNRTGSDALPTKTALFGLLSSDRAGIWILGAVTNERSPKRAGFVGKAIPPRAGGQPYVKER